LAIPDDGPSVDRIVAGRRQLQRVHDLISSLPRKCREIFVLRRVHGVPQKDVARTLGISENTVEMHSKRGLKMILKALEGESSPGDRELTGGDHGRTRQRTRD